MKGRPTLAALMEAHQESETKLASLQVEMSHVKGSIKGMDQRLDAFENESRGSFNRVFDKLDAVAAKPLPWGHLLTVAGILAAVGTAVAGGLLTLIIALAAWGGAHLDTKVQAVRAEHSVRLDAIERWLDHAADEKSTSRPVRDP